MTARLLALTAASLFFACSPDTLSGSLGAVIDLETSRVDVSRNADSFQVTWFRNRGVFLDIVIRLSVFVGDKELKQGAKLDLAGEYVPGHPRTTISHAPGGEPVRLLPTIKRGDMSITGGGGIGVNTTGNFSVLFDDTGGDFGNGRTLAGSFIGVAADAGFGPP